jgi:hypothetical protein
MNRFSNLKTLTVVALSMMITVVADAAAQSNTDAVANVCGRVTGGVITVVNVNGSSLKSDDGGQNWQVLNAEASKQTTHTLQQVLAKRQLAAQAAATGATASPNPTTGVTTISYEMAQSGEVLLTVFDAHGVEVIRQNEGVRQAGANSSAIDASQLRNGVYYYRMTVDGANSTGGKVVVAR